VTFEPWQWVLAIVGALLVGVSKTAITGLAMVSVALFSQILPPKQATGLVLPLLIFGDIVSVASYRRHAQWGHLWRLLPWATAGVVAGYLTMGRIDDRQAKLLIGFILIVLVILHFVRRRWGASDEAERAWWFPPLIGILAGFTTLVANAAGPLMVIYLLAMRLPKMEYVGTSAVFFFILNLVIKAPFMVQLGLINASSFAVNLLLAPAVFAGAWVGRRILARIDQKLFENISLGLAAAAGLRLVLW
jgi:uncharacterized membrane protein YfcA